MNFAEKLAATYLRLNGFLLLPHFTVFTGGQHNHIDIVGMRAANSVERIDAFSLPVDECLFGRLAELHGSDVRSLFIGVAAEVRTNDDDKSPSDAHIEYVKQFLGGLPIARLAFFKGNHSIDRNGKVLDIGIRYAALWIQERIDRMLAEGTRLTKTGSWNWSESFLSDFLNLRDHGLLTIARNS